MRFTTEQLPRPRGLPGVTVELEGTPRTTATSPTPWRSRLTADVVGERDWFDLGVSIRVERRELLFADVFAALATGASHMLLADGAHFSLRVERLQSLRAL